MTVQQGNRLFEEDTRLPLFSFVLHSSVWLALLWSSGGGLFFNPYPTLYHCVIFYWACRYEPFVLAVSFFCFSLIYDTLHGFLLGSTFSEIALFFFLTRWYNPYLSGRSFVMQWSIFVLMLFLFSGFVHVIGVFFHGYAYPFLVPRFLFSFVWTVCVYPIVVFILSGIEKRLHGHHSKQVYHA